jgi:hypothetical protein
MANWCNNYVYFTGENTEEVLKEFERMSTSDIGTSFKDRKPKEHYFFDVQVDGENIYFCTRWYPAIIDILDVAKEYNLGFHLEYEESGMLLYGQVKYEDGILSERSLEPDDFVDSEQTDCYFDELERILELKEYKKYE